MVIRSIGLVLLAFILQSTIADNLSIMGATPDIILIALVYVALAYGSVRGVALGFFVGLLLDFYGPAVNLGLNALCKTLLGFGIGYGKEGLYKERLSVLLTVLVVAHLFHDVLYFLIDTRFDIGLLFTMLWTRTIPSVVYTVFLGTVLVFCFAYRRGRFNARRLFPE